MFGINQVSDPTQKKEVPTMQKQPIAGTGTATTDKTNNSEHGADDYYVANCYNIMLATNHYDYCDCSSYCADHYYNSCFYYNYYFH